MLILLLNLLNTIHLLKGVSARDNITDYVYTEFGGNVILNCSYNRGTAQWTFHSKDPNISEEFTIYDQEIRNKKYPEIFDQYKLTDNETYNLQIINATKSTEGKYWCFAKDALENRSIHYFHLRLKVAPVKVIVINMTDENKLIGKDNENLTLACYAPGAVPCGKPIWYHGNEKLLINHDDSEWANYSLIVTRNHTNDIYTCMVDHDMLITSLNQSIKMDVLYRPRVRIMWPHVTVSVGHNVNLSCSYDSNPSDVYIVWTKHGLNVSSGDYIATEIIMEGNQELTNMEIMTTLQGLYNQTTIMLKNVTKTETGAYICNFSNTEGSASKTMFLIVQDIDTVIIAKEETDKPSAILIYIIACCCGVIIVLSSAELYSCLKSGKLKTFLDKRGKIEIVTHGETDNAVQNEVEMSTFHYMEIDF